MILYKYVSSETGRSILTNNKIAFSQPKFFNDPFDLPSYPYEQPGASAECILGRIRTMAKDQIWGENTGILSLTRTPTNPLMWAHYADSHRGMVIGIDVVRAGLTNEECNLIPAQYGSVIYVSRRSNSDFISQAQTPLGVGSTHHFPHDHYEKLQRLFLHKPLCWSYEEEVRVVKCLKDIPLGGGETPSGHFTPIENSGRKLFLFSLPEGSVRTVYFGIRNDAQDTDEFVSEITAHYPKLSVFECNLNLGDFSVGVRRYMTLAEAVSE